MDPLVDLLVLTGFISALFCVLGVIAGICEWAEQRFGLDVVLLSPSPTHIRKLVAKNVGARRAVSKSRGHGEVIRVAQSRGVHRKAA